MIDENSSRVIKCITINCTPAIAYSYWRDLERLPEFMTSVTEVKRKGNGVTHWKVRGPGGTEIDWDAVVTMDEPGQVVQWSSLEGTNFANAGSVHFAAAPAGRGTTVTVTMHYDPTGGAFTAAIASLFGVDVGQKISHDLRNLKQLIELGEITHSDASIHAEMHPARPSDLARPEAMAVAMAGERQ